MKPSPSCLRIAPFDALIDNPIARREWSRWRRSRASWIAPLVLATALCAAMLLFRPEYEASASNWAGVGDPPRQVLGPHALALLGLLGSVLALLLPPALAAPSIASEREAGLLEGLHLSRLSPHEIIVGKWAASLARACWMLLAALPLHLATIALGGVSVLDALGVWACEMVLVATSCAFGIFCSAWGRTALSATRSAYGFAVMHAIVCLNALSVAARGQMAVVPIPMRLGEPLHSVAAWLGATHPVFALGLSWWQPWRYEAASTGLAPLLNHPILLWSLGLQVLAAAALLAAACPGVRRPFEAMPLLQGRSSAGKGGKEGVAAQVLGWWELPVGKLVRGSNPVHGREFVTKFRMRAVPRAVLISEGVLALGVAVFYARAFWLGLFDAGSRPLIWWALLLVGVIVGMTSLLVLGANGIARERELGTWESLRLSFLSPGQILRGKMSAMLAASALFSIPFWPLLALCVHGWRSGGAGIGLFEAMCSLALVASMAWSHGALGLWLSARLKSSSATLCAMSALFAHDLLLPLAFSAAPTPVAKTLLEINAAFNPVLAMLRLNDLPASQFARASLLPTAAMIVGGTLLLWHLHRSLSREWGFLRGSSTGS